MEILYLSHCVPNPPDKGEKIRAHHAVRYLAARHRLHLVCFARDAAEREAARQLESACASVYAEPFSHRGALARAGLRFVLGDCLNTAYYAGRRARRYIDELAKRAKIEASVVFSAAMAPLAPAHIPLLLDMSDVDSLKWVQYAELRRPAFLYALEARRMRRLEIALAVRARRVWLSTAREEALYRGMAPGAVTEVLENGSDADYFNPAAASGAAGLAGRRLLVFVGTMDYYPNRDAALWFAREIYPALRGSDPTLEFFIVGRNPTADVRQLGSTAGVTVTGAVEDVRPYLAAAVAFVAPMRIARGIQNKVLEALAMGCRVLASPAVAATFGDPLPAGVRRCDSAEDYRAALAGPGAQTREQIREAARARFDWDRNMSRIDAELDRIRHE